MSAAYGGARQVDRSAGLGIVSTFEGMHMRTSNPIPSPPPPPPQPRTSSLLASSDERYKKRNLTFNLKSGNHQDEADSGKLHGSGSGNCHHHYIDEPTRVVELEPQPNNINKVKWKSPANTTYRDRCYKTSLL